MGSRRLTVLLVESSQLVLEALADMLSELDAITVVGTATNLSAALMLAERERPDLVLVDAWTGAVGVTALVGQFRTRSPSSAVAITASRCDAEIARRAAQAGALGCFEKDSLLAAMPGLLGGLGGPGGRAFFVLPLVGVVLVLMIAPPLVASVSMLDAHLLDRTQSWFDWSGALTQLLDIGRLGSVLVLGGLILRTREDV